MIVSLGLRARPRLRQFLIRALHSLPRWMRRSVVRMAEASSGQGHGEAHGHPHHSYTEQELLARAEEFNRNAEVYWKEVEAEKAGREHALSKPFTTVQDAAGILYRLGLVLQELNLGVGHTVLDLGSGSCWLSSYLNRLRCRTVSVDVSPTALKLGQELFRLDPRQRPELDPQFLPYDGHRVPLPSESVDRAVCFDSFHHVPNQDEILAEIFRVLKPGGRAVFAEPGEGHSHADQSVFETERCGVLENDLELTDLLAKANAAGFSEMLVKPYPDQSALTLRADEYLRFIDGEDHLFPIEVLRQSLRHFYIFVLTKGEEAFDSRNPRVLKAQIALPEESRVVRGACSAGVSFPVRVTNTGDTLWLREQTGFGGYVMLGGHLHLQNKRRDPVSRGFLRSALPRDVAPGESVELQVAFDLPAELGRYLLRLDMVDEWVAWFEQSGSPVTELTLVVDEYPDSRKPDRIQARIESRGPLPRVTVKPGSPLSIPLRLTNLGNTVWLDSEDGGVGAVALGGHLFDDRGAVVSWDLFRSPLGRNVAPGESLDLECRFRGPAAPGHYVVHLDLVIEGMFWFEHRGSEPMVVEVEVTGETPDSVHPGILRAAIELVEPAPSLAAAAGTRVKVAVRVVNTGNTLWLSEPHPGGGQVGLGGHLRSETREMLALDLLRAWLPRPLAPGEAADLVCEFDAPSAPGRYVVELDMVDEGITWFGSWGSPTVEITIDCG